MNKDKENHEGDVDYKTDTNHAKRKKIQQKEVNSLDIESDNQKEEDEEVIKEKIIARMIDRNYNPYSKTNQDKQNSVIPSIDNKTIYDLQTLLSQRQDMVESVLYKRYQYNTSIKRGQDFLLTHVDSKLSLVVMYADLVGSTKMSMALPVERMAKIIKVFSHELSSVVESYNGFVLKYVGDAVIAFFPSGFNKYLSCDTAFQCANSMINVIENGINPILEKDRDNYPKLAVKIGIDEGENLVIQYGYDKSAPIDLIGYPMNVAAKMTSLTGRNKITVGNNVYKLLHPSLQPSFHEMHMKEGTEWKYIDLQTNLPYKVYTTK
ncbi:MAG TPA: adenylate/guanylate cyclase domain-containing protein [Nitrososphaeraceae archaeon]|nr:adenylate/guanylate cyclase domain-containing protein [Nitrososphaeraceae archaeon]